MSFDVVKQVAPSHDPYQIIKRWGSISIHWKFENQEERTSYLDTLDQDVLDKHGVELWLSGNSISLLWHDKNPDITWETISRLWRFNDQAT